MKKCKACGLDKPHTEFHQQAATRDGLQVYCKTCSNEKSKQWRRNNPRDRTDSNRKFWYKNAYGITFEQKVEMIAAQDGCAICHRALDSEKGSHVDHDHATGALREILCGRCNMALGLFGEDTAVLRSAIAYLDKHENL